MAEKELQYQNAFYLPSGRIFLLKTKDDYPIECTEMRDVSVQGKEHSVVRTTQDPHIIWNHLKPYEDKWLLTVSTQKRSEEHTSELQSHSFISYAVFCLKKKKKSNRNK